MARLDELGEPTTFEALAANYGSASWWTWFHETERSRDRDGTPVVPRIVRGDVHLDDVEMGEAWALIVDGSIEARDIELASREYVTSGIVVLGDVRARNLRYTSSARVVIERDLVVAGVVTGSYGDTDASLSARSIEARVIALDPHTGIHAAIFDAILIGDRAWGIPTDLGTGSDDLAPEVGGDGSIDIYATWKRALAGEMPIAPELEDELRAHKRLLPLDVLALLVDDSRGRDLVATSAANSDVTVLGDWLEQAGHVVDRASLVRYVGRRRQ